MEKVSGFFKDFWGPLAAVIAAIFALLIKPWLPDVDSNALAILSAAAIFLIWLVWKFLRINLKKGFVIGIKLVISGFILLLAGGLVYYSYLSTQPHFNIVAFNTLEGDPDTYEITDMLMYNAYSLDQGKVQAEFTFQVTPDYQGQRKFGQVVAIIHGSKDTPPLEKTLWPSFSKESDPISFSLVISDVLELTEIKKIDSPDGNVLRTDQPYIPTGSLYIEIAEKGNESHPWKIKEITFRNAPWDQRSDLIWRNDRWEVDLYVKNLGGASDFIFWRYLVNANDPVDTSPYALQSGAKLINKGYEPVKMVSLKAGEVFTDTFKLDYPSEPGRYLLALYGIKKQKYIHLIDPQYSWENLYNPWWFSRKTDWHIFIIPAQGTAQPSQKIPIESVFQEELDRLQTQENIQLGSPVQPAEEVTSKFGVKGRRQVFEDGVMYAYSDQVFSIYGPIYEYLKEFDGPDLVRFPLSPIEKVTSSTGQEGLVMKFEGVGPDQYYSEIYQTRLSTAWIEGWINKVYHEDYGGYQGWLGFPVSPTCCHADSDIEAFENGYLVYYFPEVKGERDWDQKPVAFPYLAGRGSLLEVQANQGWQDTGIPVKEGDRIITFQVGGSWTSSLEYSLFDANGNFAFGLSEGAILTKALIGSLIGRIGETGDPFLLGRWAEIPAKNSGNLFLVMNEISPYFDDNSGFITVQIIVESKK